MRFAELIATLDREIASSHPLKHILLITEPFDEAVVDEWEQIDDMPNVYVTRVGYLSIVIQQRLALQLGHRRFVCTPLSDYFKHIRG